MAPAPSTVRTAYTLSGLPIRAIIGSHRGDVGGAARGAKPVCEAGARERLPRRRSQESKVADRMRVQDGLQVGVNGDLDDGARLGLAHLEEPSADMLAPHANCVAVSRTKAALASLWDKTPRTA